jgi:hypothetical protein
MKQSVLGKQPKPSSKFLFELHNCSRLLNEVAGTVECRYALMTKSERNVFPSSAGPHGIVGFSDNGVCLPLASLVTRWFYQGCCELLCGDVGTVLACDYKIQLLSEIATDNFKWYFCLGCEVDIFEPGSR